MKRFTAEDVLCSVCQKTIPHNTELHEYDTPDAAGKYRVCLPCNISICPVSPSMDRGGYLEHRAVALADRLKSDPEPAVRALALIVLELLDIRKTSA